MSLTRRTLQQLPTYSFHELQNKTANHIRYYIRTLATLKNHASISMEVLKIPL